METTIEKIQEELFCLNFELKATSDLMIYGKAERWVNGFMTKIVENEHIDRYNFILNYVKNKSILDIACGCGYGSYMMLKFGHAGSVCGVDIDENAIKYGNYRYHDKNIQRFACNALEFNYNKNFDIIVSFETIEHVANYEGLINKFYDLLDINGILFISTPISKYTTKIPLNSFHEIEWNFFDFHKLFSNKFKIEDIFLQNIKIIKYELNNFHRLINKFSRLLIKRNLFINIVNGKNLEKFEKQYDMDKCISGYQLLILRKI